MRDHRGSRGRGQRSAKPRKEPAPRRPAPSARPPKPALPEERPRLPRDVFRDLRGAAKPSEVDDVARAFHGAGQALEEGDTDRAKELLIWAKSAAPRSPVIREALGVTHYLAGGYAAAHSELLAYRRLSGKRDQNHLLADCARAAGKHEKVIQYVDEMKCDDVGADRWVEGLIVLAGDRADRGDLEGAMAALDRADLHPRTVQAYHPRLWYMAADVSERMGDPDRARGFLEAIAAVDEDYLDVAERMEGGHHTTE